MMKWDLVAKEVLDLSQTWQDTKSMPLGKNRDDAEKALTLAIQPIGWLLQSAEHPKNFSGGALTEDQQSLIVRLEQEYDAFSNAENKLDAPILKSSITHSHYTLLGLPVYIELLAPPNSRVIIKAETGGRFSPLDLPIAEAVADKHGIARFTWVSRGSGVAVCNLSAVCEKTRNRLDLTFDVKQLIPAMPGQLPDIKSLINPRPDLLEFLKDLKDKPKNLK